MALRKTVVGSFSWAVMGFALTGAAFGQVTPPGVGAPGVADPGLADPGLADPGVRAPGAAAPGIADPGIADGTIIRNGQIDTQTETEAQTPAVDAGAEADANVQNNLNNTNAGAQARGDQNRSNATANSNPFGATFDSSTADRLIIRDLQANSPASRLGLQAGDRIIEFNGRTYSDVNEFDRDLGQWNNNSDIPIVYERNGMRYTKNFRMSSQNTQQTYNDAGNGTQGFGNQSYNAGQLSHSADRPVYGMPSNGAYSGGMEQNQGYHGGAAGCGNNSSQSQVCCGGPVIVQQCGYGHRHGGHRHGGRRHQRCCR